MKRVLAICSPRGLLVGGQALAFWADRLAVELPRELSPLVTADADFIGDSTLAEELGTRLGWTIWLASLDDATPQTGKVTKRDKGGGVKTVDFLSGVVGLSTKDVVRRAVELDVPEIGLVRVMHPVDVLDSRVQNLHLVPDKRTPTGIAQAKLAIEVARAFIEEIIANQGERTALKLVERVVAIAEDIAAVRVYLRYAVDPLLAVPLQNFRTTTSFHQKRWPQIESALEKQRRTASKSAGRS